MPRALHCADSQFVLKTSWLVEFMNQQRPKLINGVLTVNAGATTAKCMNPAISKAYLLGKNLARGHIIIPKQCLVLVKVHYQHRDCENRDLCFST